jgi:hypothetical protein
MDTVGYGWHKGPCDDLVSSYWLDCLSSIYRRDGSRVKDNHILDSFAGTPENSYQGGKASRANDQEKRHIQLCATDRKNSVRRPTLQLGD